MDSLGMRINPVRMIRLARLSISDDWKPFFLTGLIICVLVIISGLLMEKPAIGALFNIMLIVGIVLIGRLFRSFQQKEKGIYLMMLPASLEEKFFVQWFFSLFGFYVYTALIVAFGGLLYTLFVSMLLYSIPITSSLPKHLWESFQIYFFFHAIFFTGALVFKNNQFLKTMLVLIVCSFLAVASTIYFLGRSMINKTQAGVLIQVEGLEEFYKVFGGPSPDSWYVMKMALVFGLPICLYLVSFIRFKNLQLRN